MTLNEGANVMMALIGGILSLIFAVYFAWELYGIALDPNKKETIKIHESIKAGAEAFLKNEYIALSGFVFVTAIVLGLLVSSWEVSICFVVGAILSASSGYFGMMIATTANVRTTFACENTDGQLDGLNNGLRVAFKSGAVMALMVVGSGLTGLSILYLIFFQNDRSDVWQHLSGFAFGGSSIALFARVGGGIYTKAADVGADLVGKVEEDLEEDSPENPATIADNVG
jgi:K(+)-stimulated pyrophosphate-energized sodium pump